MTAAVPDPRVRDELEHTARKAVQEESWATGVAMLDSDVAAYTRRLVADLLPLVAARVQAAAKDAVERAAQEVEALRPHIPPSTDPNRRTAVIVRSTLNRAARAVRAAVLAQPAPGGES